ncbi:protein kinase domain-containing protein [Nannocystis bainbridge]|uniref:Protein kinase n=1 Tax=Nannocystis bainbridge TaxID=2995303 RepID=A0ABT5DPR2_9BACT|nr:protein kinase [Nannocystis bainbridge]MDC0715642.1 protein kinase [Nannocystis bainbridge]
MSAPYVRDDDPEQIYEDAPCGYVSTRPDGVIVRANRTFLTLTGFHADELTDKRRFSTLLTKPGALLYETHCAPLLRLRGSVSEIALDVVGRDGEPLPVLLNARVKCDSHGAPELLRIALLSAPTRRKYERELKQAREQAEAATDEVRRHRALAERQLAELHTLLEAVGRLAAGDLETPIAAAPCQAELAAALERMRQDVHRQFHALIERNVEVEQLNAELRHQIEQRSLLMIELSMNAAASSPGLRLAEEQPHLVEGTILDRRYRIVGVCGRGAMGTVYEAERLLDGRRFAAKVLAVKPDFRALVRFAREAQLLARLRHPNLLTIVDVNVTADRTAYIIMELVRGATLADHRRHYGDAGFMLPILHQIADVLAAVHDAGVIHRDLKPSNVLIEGDEGAPRRVKLVDFGVSRLLAGPSETIEPPLSPGPGEQADALFSALSSNLRDRAHAPTFSPTPFLRTPDDSTTGSPGSVDESRSPSELTQVGAILGTPLYMAPELAWGAKLALPSSDVFSFGVAAHEVLTGIAPFDEPPLILAARGPGRLTFIPLGLQSRGLSSALARTLDRCLCEDAALRPSARELADAFALALRTTATASPGP